MAEQWRPLQDLLTLQERMNELFEESLGRSAGQVRGSDPWATWTPAVDIFENPSEIVVKADLPGLTQPEIQVNVEGRQLIIRGERKADAEGGSEAYHRVERPVGAFQRAFSLPPTVDEAGIRASYRDGVLRLSLPKRPELASNPITIKVD